jgi:hypothetical protein
VPDRAIIPLLPALSLGFICGIVVAALQLDDTPTIVVAVAGAIATALAGMSSVFGDGGDRSEKAIVGVLRGACALGLFGCMFLFILGFLREGKASSLIWIVLGIGLAIALTQLRVRERGGLQTDQ